MSYSFAAVAPEVKVIAGGGLGDCLLVSPFLRHFKQTTGARVVCVTYPNAAQLFDRNPYVDRLVLRDDRELMLWAMPEAGAVVFSPYFTPEMEMEDGKMKFRAIPMEEPNQKGESILLQLGRRGGIDARGFRPEIFTDQADEAWAQSVAAADPRPLIVVNPESALPEKHYPAEGWREAVAALAGTARVLLLGSDTLGLAAVGAEIAPRPGIRATAALYRRAACIVTVDSLPAHLAVAVGTRAVVLFGPSNPLVFGHPENINLRAPSCPPCADTPRRPACTNRVCLGDLPAREIVAQVRALLQQKGFKA